MVVRTRSGVPVVSVSYVERELTLRHVGTAARCLARDFPLPELLDQAFADCNASFFGRVGGCLTSWLRGTHRVRAAEENDCPPPI